jgi:Leucine-rich repeat (LRR) protein
MLNDAHDRFEAAMNRIAEFERKKERTYLTLGGLALGEIPMWLFDVGRDKLQRLDFQGNNLEELPAAIGILSHLRELDVSRNALVQLPPEIGLVSDLRVLNASDNRITAIPSEVGQEMARPASTIGARLVSDLDAGTAPEGRSNVQRLGGSGYGFRLSQRHPRRFSTSATGWFRSRGGAPQPNAQH